MQYKHLTREERYYIEQRKASQITISIRQLAREMDRSPSSISRVLKRNFGPDFGFYSGIRAQSMSIERRKSGVVKKMDRITDTIREVTLYRYINADKLNGGKLYLNLRHGTIKYRRKNNKYNVCAIVNKRRIEQRPIEAAEKREPGHWEIDTVFGLQQKSYLLTLTDKATKFQLVKKLENKEAATVLAAMQDIIAFTLLPFKTITSDNGTEFAAHELIEELTKAAFYFANPYSSWERGLNEHHNGLIRDFFPKKTDFRNVDQQQIKYVENNLNNRPRKSLGYLTPAEAMFNYVNFGVLRFN